MSQQVIAHADDENNVDGDVNVNQEIPSFHDIGFGVILQNYLMEIRNTQEIPYNFWVLCCCQLGYYRFIVL